MCDRILTKVESFAMEIKCFIKMKADETDLVWMAQTALRAPQGSNKNHANDFFKRLIMKEHFDVKNGG